MRKSVKYFIYFVIAAYSTVDIRISTGQWENCDENRKLTTSAVWKCVKKAKCVYANSLPPKLTVSCGRDELCCPEPRPSIPSAKNSTTSKQSLRNSTKPNTPESMSDAFTKANKIALDKCNEYAGYRFHNYTTPNLILGQPPVFKSKLNCTIYESLIAVGNGSPTDEYPHMALLGYDGDVTDPDMWRCGGSLISEQFILSAAHCTKTKSDREVKWAALGQLSRKEISADLIGKNLFRIMQRINHYAYRTGKADNDIALYKLEYPIKLGPTMRPICLHHQEPLRTNARAFVTGWGKMFAGGVESEELLQATILNLDSSECVKTYANANRQTLRNGFNTTTMICGGDPEGVNDTCSGDSGGPMQLAMREKLCMWIQVGVTSHGPVLCGAMPAIYTRVSYYLPWIQSLVWPSKTSTNGKRP